MTLASGHSLRQTAKVDVVGDRDKLIFVGMAAVFAACLAFGTARLVLTLGAGALKLDPVTHRVSVNGQPVQLGPTEFRLLRFFLARPERVHSRTQLLDQVWGDQVYIEERTIDVHIRRLRLALEPFGQDGLIETVRGSGYRLASPR